MNLGILITRKLHKRLLAIFMLLLISSFFGCAQKEEPLEENLTDYVIKVDDTLIEESEVMIYVYQIRKEFVEIGGENVWEFEDFSGGKSAVEVARDAVIDNILRIKVLMQKSQELGIVLEESDKEDVTNQASAFFDSVEASYIDKYDIAYADVVKVFEEFAVAGKVLLRTTEAFAPKSVDIETEMQKNEEYARIKDVEAQLLLTELHVDHILLVTREKSQSGEYVTLTPEEKAIKLEQAEKIRELALDGTDFQSLKVQYSEETFPNDQDNQGVYEFSKALLPAEFAAAILALDTGDVSVVVETELGYHLFRMRQIKVPTQEDIDNFENNFVTYEQNIRSSAIEILKQQAFDRLYEEWKKAVQVSLNKDVWESISFTE